MLRRKYAGEVVSSAGFRGCGKTQNSVILSEAKNLSLFLFLYLNRREILRFAQNDRIRPFFRSLFSLWSFVLAIINPRRLKPALLGPEIIPLPFLNQLLDSLAIVQLILEDFSREGRKFRVAGKAQGN